MLEGYSLSELIQTEVTHDLLKSDIKIEGDLILFNGNGSRLGVYSNINAVLTTLFKRDAGSVQRIRSYFEFGVPTEIKNLLTTGTAEIGFEESIVYCFAASTCIISGQILIFGLVGQSDYVVSPSFTVEMRI
jgi:hypothetical protein